MKLIKINSPKPAEDYIAERLESKLSSGKKVLWLVPGGSGIKIAAEAVEKLKTPLAGLTISLTDERYGHPGHTDSNWQSLETAGFAAHGARLLPVLTGASPAKTASEYQTMLLKEIYSSDYSLALGGMGPDGHIFGIKPGSPAVSSDNYVVDYQWEDYHRLTPTLKLLKRLDEVIIFAADKEKWPQFDNLYKDISPAAQPAQLLKQLKRVIIFNDYKEGII